MRLGDEAAIEKLHDIEGCTDDTVIFAQAVCFRNWYVRFSQCIYDAEFAIDLMGGLGEELSGWLLAHNKALARRIGELVCRVGLAKAKLCHASVNVHHTVHGVLYLFHPERGLDLWDILINPPLQRLHVDRLTNLACHGLPVCYPVHGAGIEEVPRVITTNSARSLAIAGPRSWELTSSSSVRMPRLSGARANAANMPRFSLVALAHPTLRVGAFGTCPSRLTSDSYRDDQRHNTTARRSKRLRVCTPAAIITKFTSAKTSETGYLSHRKRHSC